MTWEELADIIVIMNDEQKNTDVTICHNGEFHRIEDFDTVKFNDVLDHGHPYLSSNSAKIEHQV